MKKLPIAITLLSALIVASPVAVALLTALACAPPASAASGTFVGFETMRKIIILNQMGATEREAETGGEAASEGGAGEEKDTKAGKKKRSPVPAHFETVLSTEGAETARLTVEIGFGELTMRPAGGDTLIYVVVDYDARNFGQPLITHESSDGHVTISLESDEPHGEEFDVDMSDIKAVNTWRITLGKTVVWALDMELAYCETRLELGGLKVEALTMESGLSETELSFSEPNGAILQNCDIETGLGSFHAFRLGNAGMRQFTLENGLGSSILDFTGRWPDENLKAVIESGLGSVKMHLPDGLPVIMQVEATLGSTDLPGFHELNGGVYRSVPYREGVPGLDAAVSVGLGSVNVIWVTNEMLTLPPEPPLPPEAPEAPKKAKTVKKIKVVD